MTVIEAKKIGIMFRLHHDKKWTIKKSVMNFLRERSVQEFWAVRNVSFQVHKGECLGVIGRNGSGKSTLLRIIAGIFLPDEGTITVTEKVSALLSINSGFQPELSGLENIYLSGAIWGLKKRQVDELLDSIISFSELDSFIDVPVKTYSSGMLARLGFSIAVNIDREILLIDEILGVGDKKFRDKCQCKMQEIKQQGKTIILVSHSVQTVKSFCDNAILMDKGKLIAHGPANQVAELYLKP